MQSSALGSSCAMMLQAAGFYCPYLGGDGGEGKKLSPPMQKVKGTSGAPLAPPSSGICVQPISRHRRPSLTTHHCKGR
jgi:hypothetical protein